VCRFVGKDFHTYQRHFVSLTDRDKSLNEFPEVIIIDKKCSLYLILLKH
jgi:hypothetical protein